MIPTLTDRALLEAWAVSRGASSADRITALLERALPHPAPATAEARDRAERNLALLRLRISRWGAELEAVVSCPDCHSELEVDFDLSLLLEAGETASSASGGPITVETPSGPIQVRIPEDSELERVAAIESAAEAREALAHMSVVSSEVELSDAAIDAIGEALAAADPLGATLIAARCPDCGHSFERSLDLTEFVAAEADSEARRLAAEVHALASAYGWSEGEILELAPERRRLYLELVAG